MKSFQTFGTTNELYGKFYSHGQPNKYGEEMLNMIYNKTSKIIYV